MAEYHVNLIEPKTTTLKQPDVKVVDVGAKDYNSLPNKPQINSVELVGNKTSEELGLVDKSELGDYVKNTDYAQQTKAGIIKVGEGLALSEETKKLNIFKAKNEEILAKTNQYRPIVPSNLDYAVKTGVTTNTIELTEEEKAQAQSWLGVENKLNRTTESGYRLYSSSNGKDSTIAYTDSSVGNTIPIRRDNNNFQVGTPQKDGECANKKYVDDKFNGANKAVSFLNYSAMITSLNTLPNTSYGVGQNIMIVTLSVPDLWVSEITEESVAYTYVSDDDFVNELTTNGSVQVGYFKLSALETQKVDLTEYVKNTDYATTTKAGVLKLGSTTSGLQYDTSGYLKIMRASENDISNKTDAYRPIVPMHLDYAVKKGLADSKLVGTDNDWTDEDKASARELLGSASTDIASTPMIDNNYVGKAGLFLYDGGSVGGLFKSTTGGNVKGAMRIKKATYADIDNRSASNYHDAGVGSPNHCCPITPANLDYAVKKSLTTNTETLTDEEKAQAQNWLGIPQIELTELEDGSYSLTIGG